MKFSKKFYAPLYALLFLCLVASCTDQMREVQDQNSDIAPQAIQSQTYYAQIPGNSSEVYSMQVTTYADGSMEARREIVSYSPEQDYINMLAIGASNVQEAEAGMFVEFPEAYRVIPFDPKIPEFLGPSLAGVTVTCSCDGSGNCDLKGSATQSGFEFHCASRDCDDDCSGTISMSGRIIEIGGGTGPALLVSNSNFNLK